MNNSIERCSCGRHKRRADLEQTLRELSDRSSRFISDDELRSLETYARRMRGEIFFADRWVIVEGQADYMIVHALAHASGYNLDEHGVSVIDAQNNGSPATFAVLARALGIPWLGVFDGDDEGRKYIRAIRNRGFDDVELARRCRTHTAGDLEVQLVADGLGPELRETLAALDVPVGQDDGELLTRLRGNKTAYAATLAARVRGDLSLARRAPEAFRTTIEQLPGLK